MDKENKTIEYLIAHKNNLWTSLIVLVGGLAGLALTLPVSIEIINSDNWLKLGLILGGFVCLNLLINGLINVNNEIKRKLR